MPEKKSTLVFLLLWTTGSYQFVMTFDSISTRVATVAIREGHTSSPPLRSRSQTEVWRESL